MKKTIILGVIFFLGSFSAFAEGYQVNLQSAKQSGMAHVGAALKLGAESMHFNPAGLSFMKDRINLSVGGSAVFSSVKFSNESKTFKSDNPVGTPLYLYAGFKIYDNLAAGVSVTTPYGNSMNWGVNWAGSNLVQEISLKSFSVQPTISYRPFDKLSFGAGLMIAFGKFSLSRSLIAASGLEGLRALSPMIPGLGQTLDNYKDIAAVSTTLSGDAGVKLGYNIGAMYDMTDKITIGVSYRSKVVMEVPEGHAILDYANESELKQTLATVNPILSSIGKSPIAIPPLDEGTFNAELPLPSNLNVGVSYKANDCLLLSGEVQFVGWSAYKALNVQFSQEVLNGYSINAPKKYHNTRIYRLGGQYAATKRLDLRLGAYFDETPVLNNYLNPETPSMDKLGLSTGLSFRPVDRLSVDLAFTYVTGFGRDGSYPLTANTSFGGHYEGHAFNPSFGLSYSF